MARSTAKSKQTIKSRRLPLVVVGLVAVVVASILSVVVPSQAAVQHQWTPQTGYGTVSKSDSTTPNDSVYYPGAGLMFPKVNGSFELKLNGYGGGQAKWSMVAPEALTNYTTYSVTVPVSFSKAVRTNRTQLGVSVNVYRGNNFCGTKGLDVPNGTTSITLQTKVTCSLPQSGIPEPIRTEFYVHGWAGPDLTPVVEKVDAVGQIQSLTILGE